MSPIKIRGLEGGFERSPLQEFKGIFDRYETRAVSSEQYGDSIRVELYFRDVETIRATEPYTMPIAMISIKYSERSNSVWGIFANSLAQAVPDGVELMRDPGSPGPDCTGHRMHLSLTPGHEFGVNRETKERIIIECWEVVSVEGYDRAAGTPSSISPKVRALQLLDGKTLAEWHSTVFTDPTIRGSSVVQEILNNEFLPPLIEAGLVGRDEQGIHNVSMEA